MKILIVDDDADIAESTQMLLELEGHEAAGVLHSTDIVGRASNYEPNVILHDVNMPGLHLEESIHNLRTTLPEAKIFLFTASAEGRQLVQKCKADGIVSKPFRVADLLRLITD